MNHLKSLQSKIQKACPEIMRLQFGCEVMVGKLKHTIYQISENHYSACMIFENEWVDVEIGKNRIKDVKIIGKPITLEDILIALENKKQIKVSIGDFEGCEEDEECIREDYCVFYDFRKLLHLWQLNKPLHLQSKDTIKSLDELL